MTDGFAYKPRLGIDIRVKPPRGDNKKRRKTTAKAEAQPCAWPGCTEKGLHRAPTKKGDEKEFQMLCLDHVREFNKSWNYFDDMSAEEAQRLAEASRTGERPTWAYGRNVGTDPEVNTRSASAEAGPPPRYQRGFVFPSGVHDPYQLFKDDAGDGAPRRVRRKLTKIQITAFETLGLPETSTSEEVKGRYKELVKRFHPDTNGGDTSTVDRLRQVIKAYNSLKSSGLA